MSSKKTTRVVWAIEIDKEGVEVWKTPSPKHFHKLNERLLVTTHCFKVKFFLNGKTIEFTIPKGWEFDGASIPRIFWAAVGKPTSSKFRIASMVHDWMYGNKMHRKASDYVFKYLLVSEGVFKLKAQIMWAAVRVGGHFVYHSQESVAQERVNRLVISNL